MSLTKYHLLLFFSFSVSFSYAQGSLNSSANIQRHVESESHPHDHEHHHVLGATCSACNTLLGHVIPNPKGQEKFSFVASQNRISLKEDVYYCSTCGNRLFENNLLESKSKKGLIFFDGIPETESILVQKTNVPSIKELKEYCNWCTRKFYVEDKNQNFGVKVNLSSFKRKIK